MKRQHGKNELLFSENLVFYAPLRFGDLTNHYNGASPTIDEDCSCTWDNNKGMYLLSVTNGSNNTYKCALNYSCPEMSSLFSSGAYQQITVTGLFEWVSHIGDNNEAFFSVSNKKQSSNTNLTWTCGGTTKYGLSQHPVGIHRLTAVLDDSTYEQICIRYEDNEVVYSMSPWPFQKNAPDSVGICQLLNNQTAFSCYAKDVRVYNRALSAAEIAQL